METSMKGKQKNKRKFKQGVFEGKIQKIYKNKTELNKKLMKKKKSLQKSFKNITENCVKYAEKRPRSKSKVDSSKTGFLTHTKTVLNEQLREKKRSLQKNLESINEHCVNYTKKRLCINSNADTYKAGLLTHSSPNKNKAKHGENRKKTKRAENNHITGVSSEHQLNVCKDTQTHIVSNPQPSNSNAGNNIEERSSNFVSMSKLTPNDTHKMKKSMKRKMKKMRQKMKQAAVEMKIKIKEKSSNDNASKESTKIIANMMSPLKNNKKNDNFKRRLQEMLSQQHVEPKPKTNEKLTLRERMMEKLKAARFRYLNEQIYTQTGKDAEKLFRSDPESFRAYHEGYQQQVKKWPLNPVDVIIRSIRKMPISHVIADLGCGEATIAKSVDQTVQSFDLVSVNESVIACDMSKVPLKNASVDVAVFCLSLMGTNLQDYILEANRILKIGGILKIAEVESRFDNIDDFIEGVQHFNFKNTWKDLSHNLFYFLDFKKISDVKAKKRMPTISLKPCIYKKR